MLQFLRNGVASRRFALLLSVCLLAFLVSFFLPLSRKAANNIFYIGVALPTLACLLCWPRAMLAILRRYSAFLLLLAGMALLYALREPSEIKLLLYLVLLLGAFSVLDARSPNNSVKIFSALSAITSGLLLVSIAQWVWTFLSTGSWVRMQLWGAAENPVHAALMLNTMLAFVWVFHIDPNLGRYRPWLRYLALFFFIVVSLLCLAVFQARSALLGFTLFLLVYLALRRMLLGGALVVLAVLVLWCGLGLQEVLMERGVSYRLAIWQDVVTRASRECSMLLGCGPSNYRFLGQFYHPHSAYLSLFYRIGFLGVTLFSLFSLAFFWVAARGHSRWMLVSLIAWGGVVTSSSGVFVSPQPIWVYFWCPVFLALLEARPAGLQLYLPGGGGEAVVHNSGA